MLRNKVSHLVSDIIKQNKTKLFHRLKQYPRINKNKDRKKRRPATTYHYCCMEQFASSDFDED